MTRCRECDEPLADDVLLCDRCMERFTEMMERWDAADDFELEGMR